MPALLALCLQVCGQEFFTKTEDRPVVKERVDYIKEHRPVEKEFVVSCGWKGGDSWLVHCGELRVERRLYMTVTSW